MQKWAIKGGKGKENGRGRDIAGSRANLAIESSLIFYRSAKAISPRGQIDRSIDRSSMAITLVGSCLHTSNGDHLWIWIPRLPTFRHVLENLVKRHTYLLTLLEEFLISLFPLFEIKRIFSSASITIFLLLINFF